MGSGEICPDLSWYTVSGLYACRADVVPTAEPIETRKKCFGVVKAENWSGRALRGSDFSREILESLPGPLTFSGRDITEESFEQMKKAIPEETRQEPFVKLMLKLPWEEARGMANAGREMAGNCGTTFI